MPVAATSSRADTHAALQPDRACAAGGQDILPKLFDALQVLRVAATFLVVMGHSSIAYMVTPLRTTTPWLVYDRPAVIVLDYLGHWINGWVLPLFFLISGALATPACAARGPAKFLGRRTDRLLKPLLFGCVTVLPATYAIWAYGLLVSERCGMSNLMRMRFAPSIQPHMSGLLHLWFLLYLYLVSVAWCGGWWLWRIGKQRYRGVLGDWPLRLLSSRWRLPLLVLPTAAILGLDPDVFLTVDNSLAPNLCRLLHFGLFFVVGSWIAKVPNLRQKLAAPAPFYLALSAVVFAALGPLLLRHVQQPLHGAERVMYTLLAAVFIWSTLLALLGLALRWCTSPRPSLRFLDEASFWVYFSHLPMVALMQVALVPLSWPAEFKFAIVFGTACSLSLLSYEWIVRYSLVGVIINGKRQAVTTPHRWKAELGWIGVTCLLLAAILAGTWYYRGFLLNDNLYAEASGRVYRSARLKADKLDELIKRRGLRSVICVFNHDENDACSVAQKKVCQSHQVQLHVIHMMADELPTVEQLQALVEILDTCGRPVLLQGNWGIGRSGLSAAVARLLDGAGPDEALRQFDMKYGQIEGAGHAMMAKVVHGYRQWLDEQGQVHSPEQFRTWVSNAYLDDRRQPPQYAPSWQYHVLVGSPRHSIRITR